MKGRNSQKLITRPEKIEIGERQTSSSYWRMRTKSSQISFFSLLLFLSSNLSSDQVGERETTLKMSSWFLLILSFYSDALSQNCSPQTTIFFVLFTGKCCLDGARRVFFLFWFKQKSKAMRKIIWVAHLWEMKRKIYENECEKEDEKKTKFNCRQFRCFIFFCFIDK